jgi:hemolysin activation/secretion protein
LRSPGLDSKRKAFSAWLRSLFVHSINSSLFGMLDLSSQSDDLKLADFPQGRRRTRRLTASLRHGQPLLEDSLSGRLALSQGIGTTKGGSAAISGHNRFLTEVLDYDRPLGKRTSLRLWAAAQYSSSKLPSVVQFSLGGNPYGLTFDGGTLSGDSGMGTAIKSSPPLETGTAAFASVMPARLRTAARFGTVTPPSKRMIRWARSGSAWQG